MVKKLSLFAGLFVLCAGFLFALDPSLKRADTLHAQGRFSEAQTLLLQALDLATSQPQKAAIYWRLSREYLGEGDDAHGAGKKDSVAMDLYQKGEHYGDLAIQADPSDAQGYFWKSGNLGKVGLLKGPLNSLAMVPDLKKLLTKTIEIDPQELKAYYALGQLYAKVPGWPLSIGNTDFAVSLARKSVALLDQRITAGTEDDVDFGFYLELARDLHSRNWDRNRRTRELASKRSHYSSASDVLEKSCYFEGTVSLPAMSDRQEATQIVQRTIARINAKQTPLTARDRRELGEAKKLLHEWS